MSFLAENDRVAALARDMLISVAAATGSLVREQDIREIVRQARVFWDEVDRPTPSPSAEKKSADDEGADLLAEDDLADA